MSERNTELIDRFYRCMAMGDERGLAELYAPDAAMIRFDGTSEGVSEIIAFLSTVRERHQKYELEAIDQVTQAEDVLMWDAMVRTTDGLLQTTEVLVLDKAGKIVRHIPGMRGYWGL